jgi:hypothetical protein
VVKHFEPAIEGYAKMTAGVTSTPLFGTKSGESRHTAPRCAEAMLDDPRRSLVVPFSLYFILSYIVSVVSFRLFETNRDRTGKVGKALLPSRFFW